MDDHQITRVLALLAAVWPDTEQPDATIALWAESLRDVDPADGMEAAATLTRTSTWYPKLAEYREAVNAVRRRNVVDASRVVALPSIPLADRDIALAHIAEIRAQLAAIPPRHPASADKDDAR